MGMIESPTSVRKEWITPKQQKILTLLASGDSYKEIAVKTALSYRGARSQMYSHWPGSIASKLDTSDKGEAIMKGLALNIINVEDIAEAGRKSLSEFVGIYLLLSPAEKSIIHTMTFDGGKTISDKALSHHLGISPNTVRHHVSNILEKTTFTDRVQLAVLGLTIRNIRAVQIAEEVKQNPIKEMDISHEVPLEIPIWEIPRRKRISGARFAESRRKNQRRAASKDEKYNIFNE